MFSTKTLQIVYLYSDSAYQIWTELEERFGQSNGASFYQLQRENCSISQGNNDIATYFTRMKRSWDELSIVSELPACTCGSAQSLVKFLQDQKLIQFLMGLNSEYNTIRGNILMMKPLPSINQAYSLLMQDEKQREVHSVSHFMMESASMNVAAHMQEVHSVPQINTDLCNQLIRLLTNASNGSNEHTQVIGNPDNPGPSSSHFC